MVDQTELAPCSCGEPVDIIAKGLWRGGLTPSDIGHYELRHHCKLSGSIFLHYVQIQAKFKEDVVLAWNSRIHPETAKVAYMVCREHPYDGGTWISPHLTMLGAEKEAEKLQAEHDTRLEESEQMLKRDQRHPDGFELIREIFTVRPVELKQ